MASGLYEVCEHGEKVRKTLSRIRNKKDPHVHMKGSFFIPYVVGECLTSPRISNCEAI